MRERETVLPVEIRAREDVIHPSSTQAVDWDSDASVGTEQCIGVLFRAADLMRNRLDAELAEFNLNEVRFAVLQFVVASGPDGCSQRELADALKHSESGVSTLVERMRANGLLERTPSLHDRRKSVLTATETGNAFLERVRRRRMARLEQLFGNLSAVDVAQLTNGLSLLIDWPTQSRAHCDAA